MRLSLNPFLPTNDDYTQLRVRLYDLFIQIAKQVNGLSDGLSNARLTAAAAPTTGTHAAGDIVYNNAPSELGMTLSKYVIIGWICTVGGTPGTWLEMRTLTGN
jgi:hypothetical protein